MKLINLLTTLFLSNFNLISAQADIVPLGGQGPDQFGCVADGGYTWCISTQKCIRPWEEDCEELYDPSLNEHTTEFCDQSPDQTCRMMCNTPMCDSNQCALRVGSCCDYTCQDNLIVGGIYEGSHSCPPCPPPMPCPNIYPNRGCVFTPPPVDNCGCQTSCGTFDCSSLISQEGEECGGYIPDGMAKQCADGLDCVNIMGPMIADAPGVCQQSCEFERDSWGNCIDEGCKSWFDGCNTCRLNDNHIIRCTEKVCHSNKDPMCIDNGNNLLDIPEVPLNCATWFDGCNTCSVNNGIIQLCTMMMCFTQQEQYCRTFTSDPLIEGDICYRFCEDNSQNSINRRRDCPAGTTCSTTNNLIGFDNCGRNSLTCIPAGH